MKCLRYYLLLVVCLLLGNSYSQSLDSVLLLVVENNPELKSLQLEFEAAQMKADQVSQLSDPQLGVGIPILRPETRLGPQIIMVSASQMFPWFGTLKSQEDVEISMSKVKYERIENERLRLFNNVKTSYFKLQFLVDKRGILGEILAQLETLKSIALVKVEAGQTSTANVLRVQLKIDEVQTALQQIEQEKSKEFANINSLIMQPWDNEINPGTSELQLLNFDLASFESKIKEQYPMMQMLELQKEVSQERLDVNKKMGAPMLGLGLDYSLVNKRTDMNPEYNGRDILIPKLMFTLPIYRKSYKAKEKEELLIQESIDFEKTQLERELLAYLLKNKADYESASLSIQLALAQQEMSKSAYEILLKEYSASGKGFDDLLQIQMQVLGYKINEKQNILVANIAKSNIDQLTDY